MGNQALFVDDVQLRSLLKSMDTIGAEFSRKSTRRRISNEAAKPVQEQARTVAAATFKKSPRDSVHYYYRKGKRIATFHAGHTEAALQVITRKRAKLPRATAAVVGPLKTGKAGSGGTFRASKAQNPSKVDAYYAQMIFGNALAFGKRITQRALQLAAGKAFRVYQQEVDKELTKQARRTGWR